MSKGNYRRARNSGELQYAPSFGIYRPATDEWRETAGKAMEEAHLDTEGMFNGRSGQLEFKTQHGLTYLPRGKSEGWEIAGHKFDNFLNEMQTYAAEIGAVELPIANLEWTGYNDTVLAARPVVRGRAEKRMVGEYRAIQHMLHHAGVRRPPQLRPNHIALARYEVGAARLNDMTDDERGDIINIADYQLSAAKIGSISLAPLVIGNGYDRPYIIGEWQEVEEDF